MGAIEQTQLDLLWLLVSAALVMLMQAGFCALESGLVRTKNSINVALKNLLDFMVAGLVFLAFGYGLIFGASWSGVLGDPGHYFHGALDVGDQVYFLYQLMFCGTAVTIVSGAVAERMRLPIYLAVAVWMAALVYPLVAHGAWNPAGWLAKLGFIDFAGATVVHVVGGWAGLALVLLIGPRHGRFDFERHAIQGANIPLATLGVLLLWFGWLGFNGGSFGTFNDRVPAVILNTVFGGMAGGAMGLAYSLVRFRLADIRLVLLATIAGLVSVTAGAHLFSIQGALIAGGIGAILSCFTISGLDRMQIDDAVDAFAAHGIAGFWGTLAVALLGDPTGFMGGASRLDQFVVQAVGTLFSGIWAFASIYVPFRILMIRVPLRVSRQDEEQGLNMAEHGVSNEMRDLLLDLEAHRQSPTFDAPAHVEPFTEVGQVAAHYNAVMERMIAEKIKALETARDAFEAEREGRQLRQELERKIGELNQMLRLSMGRELQMIALKEEINLLAGKAGEPPRYDLAFWEKNKHRFSG